MIFCPECGTENPDNAKFCYKCGKNIAELTGVQKEKQVQVQEAEPVKHEENLRTSPPEPESSNESAYGKDEGKITKHKFTYAKSPDKKRKKSSKNIGLLILIEGIALVLAVGVIFAVGAIRKKTGKTEKSQGSYIGSKTNKKRGSDDDKKSSHSTKKKKPKKKAKDKKAQDKKPQDKKAQDKTPQDKKDQDKKDQDKTTTDKTTTDKFPRNYSDEDEYVIADSNKRELRYSDIAGLSVQKLNYAKNEIYARHGRRFRSGELQDYFNGKSWYRGLYEPDEFDKKYSEHTLSDIEKKNIDFLREAEYKAQSGGYKLKY